ncbi:hypothetical protein GCM10027084_14420 [Pseudoxanthomonas sangjuensis]
MRDIGGGQADEAEAGGNGRREQIGTHGISPGWILLGIAAAAVVPRRNAVKIPLSA